MESYITLQQEMKKDLPIEIRDWTNFVPNISSTFKDNHLNTLMQKLSKAEEKEILHLAIVLLKPDINQARFD